MEVENKGKYPTLGRYICLQTLGSGFNAKVKLGQSMDDQKYVAIKIMKS